MEKRNLSKLQYDPKFESKENKNPKMNKLFVAGVAVAAVIIIGGLSFAGIRNMSRNSTEKMIEQYLESYAGNMTDDEIVTLTKDLSHQIDEQISQLDTSEMSEAELERIMSQVMVALSESGLPITDSEVQTLTQNIMKDVLSKLAESNESLAADYESKVKSISERLTLIEAKKILSEKDVIDIIKNTTLTEEQIKSLLESKYNTTELLEKITKTYGVSVDQLKDLIDDANDKTEEFYYKLSDILDMDESDIKKLFETTAKTDSKLNELSSTVSQNNKEIKQSISDIEKQINEAMKDGNTALADELALAKSALEEALEKQGEEQTQALAKAQNQLGKAMGEADDKLEKKIEKTNSDLNKTIDELEKKQNDNLDAVKTEMNNYINQINNNIESSSVKIEYKNDNGTPTLIISNVKK